MRGSFLITALMIAGVIGWLIYHQNSSSRQQPDENAQQPSTQGSRNLASQLKSSQEIIASKGSIWIDDREQATPAAVTTSRDSTSSSAFQPDEIQRQEAERRAQRDAAPVIEHPTALVGKTIPFRIILTPGWKILSDDDPLVVSYGDLCTATVETGPWNTKQKEFAEKTLEDLATHYPDMELVEQSLVELDGQTWARFHFQEKNTLLTNPRKLLVLTYGSRQGSYRILIGGRSRELDESVDIISRFLGGFRFPPDNFKPEGASSVRVYVDGKRWYF